MGSRATRLVGALIFMGGTLVAVPWVHAEAADPRPRCTIVGTAGPDRLVGTSKADVICGRGGNDTLIGRGGNDVLIGGPGRDVVTGGAGDDRLRGERGPDEMFGGTGRDKVLGGGGDDDLDGGPAKDTVDGGSGNDYCTIYEDDVEGCVLDEQDPAVDQISFSTDTVDVTDGDRTVTVRMHVTDDTGAYELGLFPGRETPWFVPIWSIHLESGTTRDGWWSGTYTFNQWSRPGTYRIARLLINDRTGREVDVEVDGPSVTVLNQTPDLDNPEIELITPSPDLTVDTTAEGQSVFIRARITDAQTGVDPDRVSVNLWSPRIDGEEIWIYGAGMRKISGTVHDGIWKGEVYLDEDVLAGEWSVAIYASDRANPGRTSRSVYWGPAEYPFHQFNDAEGENRPFPNGMGGFTVLGR